MCIRRFQEYSTHFFVLIVFFIPLVISLSLHYYLLCEGIIMKERLIVVLFSICLILSVVLLNNNRVDKRKDNQCNLHDTLCSFFGNK